MRLKQFLSALLIVSIILSLAACGNSKKPEDTVKAFLDTYKSADFDNVANFLETDDGVLESIKTSDENEDNQLIIKALTSNLEYKINNSTVSGDTAVVTVEMKNADMETIMGNVISELFGELFNMTDENEIEEKLSSILLEQLSSKDNEPIKTTVDINLNKVDGEWKIVGNIDLYDGMTGNFVSYSTAMGDAFSDLGE